MSFIVLINLAHANENRMHVITVPSLILHVSQVATTDSDDAVERCAFLALLHLSNGDDVTRARLWGRWRSPTGASSTRSTAPTRDATSRRCCTTSRVPTPTLTRSSNTTTGPSSPSSRRYSRRGSEDRGNAAYNRYRDVADGSNGSISEQQQQ